MPQSLPVHPVAALKDNYVWLFPTAPGRMAAVDPGEADPVLAFLAAHGATLSHILLTHHHHDHTGGVAQLARHSGCQVVGAAADRHRLPLLTLPTQDGDQLSIGEKNATVLGVPGHTTGHVAYRIDDALFSGDTLFGYGAGRLFEGTPEMMWESLLKIRALPDATRVCAGHEYTLHNLRFAHHLEPDNPELNAQLEALYTLTDAGQPTLPTPLGREKRCNPFLRCDDPAFAAHLGLAGASPARVLAWVREQRNRY